MVNSQWVRFRKQLNKNKNLKNKQIVEMVRYASQQLTINHQLLSLKHLA